MPVRTRAPAAAVALAAAGWALAVAAEAIGRASGFHHDALIHSTLPLWLALGASLLAWQVMFAAMMVPSAMPVVGRVSRTHATPRRAAVVFLGAYALVWTAFGAAAFLGDAVLHRTADRVPWMAGNRWVVAGAVLALAGLFQFTGAKRACLARCRAFDPGERTGFRSGVAYGLACLGDCWALMLVMFAAGVGSVWWMAALTALMVVEKNGHDGERAATFAGIAMLGLAGLVFLHPAWIAGLVTAG